MHHSRLCSFIIDCKADDLEVAVRFWSAALGRQVQEGANPAHNQYVGLVMHADEPIVEVQKVGHESRVHLDIESDDIEAEVKRLEALGAKVSGSVSKKTSLVVAGEAARLEDIGQRQRDRPEQEADEQARIAAQQAPFL